jgi:AbrB family looped-hinge helix DNA binding protein
MTTVDSKGRIVLPQEVREQLGITPGTEVEVRNEDGKVVVEPEDDPDEILSRMERLVKEASPKPEKRTSMPENPDPIVHKHRESVRRGAKKASDE